MYMATTLDKENFFEFSDWESAKKASQGYSNEFLVNEYFEINSKNKFEEIEIYPPRFIELFCAIQKCLRGKEILKVADYGGGNGYLGVYAKRFLNMPIHWEVFEQKEFVKIYQQIINEDILFRNLEEYRKEKYDITLFSCSIQYIENWREIVENSIKNSDYLIITRMPITSYGKDQVTVQKVWIRDKEFSWPAYFFSEETINYFNSIGKIIYRWNTPTEKVLFQGKEVEFQGLILSK